MRISQYTTDNMKEKEVCFLIKINGIVKAVSCQLSKAKNLACKKRWIRNLAELTIKTLERPK